MLDQITLIVLIIITSYLLITLFIGIYGYKISKKSVSDYFLADRKIGTLVLFFTLTSTNFSAFTFLGFSGSAYEMGYSFYGLMAFGTSFFAFSFYLVGRKVRELGKEKGYITPPELIGKETDSFTLRILFFSVMVVFTLPYLAIQPMSAGYVLSALTNGAIPYFWGAVFLTVFIIIYVFLGGMRSIAWTDVIQGLMVFFFLLIAVVVISKNLGGIVEAHAQAKAVDLGIFSRDGSVSVKIWLSYGLLWSFCNPMFPQVFQRFFMAKDEKGLKISMIIFPLLVSILFLFPVMIGVMGRGAIPGLEANQVDSILPLLLERYSPIWLSTLIMSGGFAAFMSTADSQLLTLSSMFTKDVIHPLSSTSDDYKMGHLMVVVLALIGLAIAYDPPATIFTIVTWAFTGLAILYPVTIGVLYFDSDSTACVLSLVVGLIMLMAYNFSLLPTFGFLPAIPIVLTTTAVLFTSDNIIRIWS
ncbi:MAG: sodium:solute symporter family protein [Candidatus Natronoplasma sp.]